MKPVIFRARIRAWRARWQRRRRLVFFADITLLAGLGLGASALSGELLWGGFAGGLIGVSLQHRYWPYWRPPIALELLLIAALFALAQVFLGPPIGLMALVAGGVAVYGGLDHWTRPSRPDRLEGSGPAAIIAMAPQALSGAGGALDSPALSRAER